MKSAVAVGNSGLSTTVRHCEPDQYLEGNVVFTQDFSLHTTDGTTSTNIAGHTSNGYKDGVGEGAMFYFVWGFYQWNKTTLLVVDSDNNCIRHVSRITRQTGSLAGGCTTRGSSDGIGRAARFSWPWDIILDNTNTDNLLITDRKNNAIRSINMNSLLVSTVVGSRLNNPIRIQWSPDNVTLFAMHYSGGISAINWNSKEANEITRASSSAPHNQLFFDAITQQGTDFSHIHGPYYVVVYNNETVHIVDLVDYVGWTLCLGSPNNCSLPQRPYSVFYGSKGKSLIFGSSSGEITEYKGTCKRGEIYRDI